MIPELELEDELVDEELLELVDEELLELLELVEEELVDVELLELDEEVLAPGVSFPPHPTSATAVVNNAGTRKPSDKLGLFIGLDMALVMARVMARAPNGLDG